MTLVTPKTREELPDMEPIFNMVETSMGFVPTSMLTMAHWPELLQTFGAFAGNVLKSAVKACQRFFYNGVLFE